MPSEEMLAQLQPESVFLELDQSMQKFGLQLMYPFRTDSERDTYHVSAIYARETTRLFFLPGRGFLIRISLAEHIDSSGYSFWWNCRLYLSLDDNAMIRHEVFDICTQHPGGSFMNDCEPLKHMLGSGLDDVLLPFHRNGGSGGNGVREWNVESRESSIEIVSMIARVLIHFQGFFLPKLGDARGFDAFTFTNDYAWPDCRERFWRGFPTRILRELTYGRIRGRESLSAMTRRR